MTYSAKQGLSKYHLFVNLLLADICSPNKPMCHVSNYN